MISTSGWPLVHKQKRHKPKIVHYVSSANVIVTRAIPHTHASRPRQWLGDPTYTAPYDPTPREISIDSPAAKAGHSARSIGHAEKVTVNQSFEF